ncbi:MAG TPA: aminotransferase [Chthoniobacteraceae bacterium]|nr:aminotransferase [Chthoniobacteraceae bacterium]
MARTAALQQLDQSHHLHPFTDHTEMHAQGTHIMVGGNGVFVQDERGRQYLDGLSGLWCVNVGYGRTEIIDAVAAQLRQLAFYPSFFQTTTEPAIRLAERLAKIAPPRLNRTIFCNSGSEANESALKIIRAYWKLRDQPQRTKILSRMYSYHGVTLATASMSGGPEYCLPFDLPLPGFIQVPGPYAYGADQESDPARYGKWCLEETARTIEREGAETIAAIFIEPVQGPGGVIVPPEGHLAELRALCRAREILFVADEVVTGFGRLGAWFASNRWSLDPDLMTLAKGLTSGYLPLGATMVSDEIADVLCRSGIFAHGFTAAGHPASCAAALANIELLDNGLNVRARADLGPHFQQRLQGLEQHPAVAEVRGLYLMGALELVPRGGKAELSSTSQLGTRAATIAREKGLIVRGIRNSIALAPPLTTTYAEMDELFAMLRQTLDALWE